MEALNDFRPFLRNNFFLLPHFLLVYDLLIVNEPMDKRGLYNFLKSLGG
jgi:hypothetical protein